MCACSVAHVICLLLTYYITLRCTMYWFDTFMYCNMAITVALTDTSILSYNFLFCVCDENISDLSLSNFEGYQFSSVAQSCMTLYDPMDCSTSGFPVHHEFPEFAQTYVNWIGDAIEPPHPLSSPSPPTFSLSRIRVFSKESVLCIRCDVNCGVREDS